MKWMRSAIIILVVSWSFHVRADDCKAEVQLQTNGHVTIDFCLDSKITQGTQFTMDVGGVTIPMEIQSMEPKFLAVSDHATAVATTPDTTPLTALADGGEEVVIHINNQDIKTNVHPTTDMLFKNYRKYDWSLGPATKGSPNGGSGDSSSSAVMAAATTTGASSSTGAIRLQYNGEFAKGQPFADKSRIKLQTVGTLAIDTTDQHDPGFIDNNRGTFGLELSRLPLGNLLKQGRVGIEARASKAFHQDVHDLDGVITFAAWVPAVPSLNVLNRDGNFGAPPLRFNASYGYRNRDQSSEKFHGRVFEGTAVYSVFALDKINIDFTGTWTINDMSNRPATTPKTQRLYKATVSYFTNPDKGFELLTTIEDGSAGVMLTKVRQYFVGMALSKINFSGGSGKP